MAWTKRATRKAGKGSFMNYAMQLGVMEQMVCKMAFLALPRGRGVKF